MTIFKLLSSFDYKSFILVRLIGSSVIVTNGKRCINGRKSVIDNYSKRFAFFVDKDEDFAVKMSLRPMKLMLAMDLDRGIAKGNKLPWKIRKDMQFFQDETTAVKDPAKVGEYKLNWCFIMELR